MAITYIGGDAQDRTSGGNLTLTMPGAATTDDLGLIFIACDDDAPTLAVTTPGWTLLQENQTTGGRDLKSAIWYRVLTSGSETNPVCNLSGSSQEFGCTLHVYRGVDPVAPFPDGVAFRFTQNTSNPTPPSTSVTVPSSALHIFTAVTHDDITTVVAPVTPSGLTVRETIHGSTKDWRQQINCSLLDVGSVTSVTPTAWRNVVTSTVAESHAYSLILSLELPIAISDVNGGAGIQYGQTGIIATGKGFGATQGSGKLELWSDTSGTIKTVQTITAWSDTSITFTAVKGSLSDNTTVYAVATNDSAEESLPLAVSVGLPSYRDLIDGLSPNHYWALNNNYNDRAGSNNMTQTPVGTQAFVTPTIDDYNTVAAQWQGATGRREAPDSPDMNTSALQERTMGGWIEFGSDIQSTMHSIYKEGGGVNNLAFLSGFGNSLMAQLADTNDDNVQAYADFALTAARPYHILFRYSYLENPAEFRLFIDGEEQAVTSGNPLTATDLDGHSGDIVWGAPDTSLEMGGENIVFTGQDLTKYSHWATWKTALPKTSVIRDQLYRRGAKPDYTVTGASAAAMQTDVTTNLAGTARRDWPLCVRVEKPTGTNDLTLTLNNVTFSSRATSHIEWRGASGSTLTIIRQGTTDLVASKCWSSTGASISILDAVQVLVRAVDTAGSPVAGARVLLTVGVGGPGNILVPVAIVESGGTATVTQSGHGLSTGDKVLIGGCDQGLLNGVKTITVTSANAYTYATAAGQGTATGSPKSTDVLLEDVTDSNGEVSRSDYVYTSDQSVLGRVRRGTTSPLYQTANLTGTITSDGLESVVLLISDE